MADDKEKNEDLELAAGEQKGSKKMLIILIAVGALVLVGGGVAAWLLLGGDSAEEGAEAETEQEAQVEQAPPIYFPLDPKFVVNLPPGGKAKMLQLELQLMARNQETIDFLKHNNPMVRHALLDLFGTQDSTALGTRAGKEKLQADVVKTLNKIVKEQGGQGEVEAAFFTAFVTQ